MNKTDTVYFIDQKGNTKIGLYENPRATKIEVIQHIFKAKIICKNKKVYFFGTSFKMSIKVDDRTTIFECIKIIIEDYMVNTISDKSLMKYPKHP